MRISRLGKAIFLFLGFILWSSRALGAGEPVCMACFRPELLQATQITDTSARLIWTDVADFYELEIRPLSEPLTGTPTHFLQSDPPYEISGLTPGEQYRFSVRAVCQGNIVSEWGSPRSFATQLNNRRPCPLAFDLRDTSCNAGGQIFHVNVDNAPGIHLGGDTRIQSVRLMVEHPWRSDLKIWLQAPDGTKVQLIGGLNAGDKNIGNPDGDFCAQPVDLTEEPGALPLYTAAEHDNITGYFLPYQSFATFYNNQPPNGIWQLEICDNKTNDKGKLRAFGIVFASIGCATPDSVQVSSVTASSAHVKVAPAGMGDYLLVEYGPAGFFPGNAGTNDAQGTVLVLSDSTALEADIAGLEVLHAYDIYVRRRCASGVWSANTFAQKIYTHCPPSLSENFDSLSVCTATCSEACAFAGVWQNIPGDDYDWKVRTGPGLTFPAAGPSAASAGAGNYLFFRNSCSPSGAPGKKAILRSSCIKVSAPDTSVCHFSLDLYMNTKIGQMSSLLLQISTDGGISWTTIRSWSGNQGKRWRREFIDLHNWHNQTVLFQLVATGVLGAYGDIALDNLAFYGSEVDGTASYTYYRDSDQDGFGNAANKLISCSTVPPPGYSVVSGDCDDAQAAIYPGATEIWCNQRDENCNGLADDSQIPIPAVAMPAPICVGQETELHALNTPVGAFYWYDQPSGGQALGSGNSLSITAERPEKTFYLLDSISGVAQGCASPRAQVTVHTYETPVLALGQVNLVCAGTALELNSLPVVDSTGVSGVFSYRAPEANGGLTPLPQTIFPNTDTAVLVIKTAMHGCADTLPVFIPVAPAPLVQIEQGDTLLLCRDRQVMLYAVGSAGTPPLKFSWNTGILGENLSVAGQDNQPAACYVVTVSDQNNCLAKDSIHIYTPLSVSKTIIEDVHHLSFCGGSDGSVRLRPADGTPPYAFSWSGPTTGSISGVAETIVLSELKQGSYRITVSDANDACFMVMPQIILNAPGLQVSLDTIQSPICHGSATGRIALNVDGVQPQIWWSNGQQGLETTGLTAGSYAVTINDGGCNQVLANLEITEPPLLDIYLQKLLPVSCYGAPSGLIDVSVSGGASPYFFSWSNGNHTEDLVSVPAGNYWLTVTDANGCTTDSPIFTIPQPPLLSVGAQLIQPVSCAGAQDGSFAVTAAGGLPPYAFKWSNGSSEPELENLPAGEYSVTITDAGGCTAYLSGQVTQPLPLEVNKVYRTNPTCVGTSDGQLEVLASGGEPPYSFLWSTGLPEDTTALLANKPAGTYALTVSDQHGCSIVLPGLILFAPQLLSVQVDTLKSVSCYGEFTGKIVVSSSGALGAVSYTWNGIPGNQVLSGIPAGTYDLVVKDERNCALTQTIEVSQPSSPLTISIAAVTDALCAGQPTGSIDIEIEGGTPPYQTEWSNGQITEDLPAASAGLYSLLVLDAGGCTEILTKVEVTEPIPVVITPMLQHIPCYGLTTGSITLDVSGGQPPYTYLWNTGQSTPGLYNLAAGEYSVTVIDHLGCVNGLDQLEVENANSQFFVSSQHAEPVSCPGAADGKVSVTVQNGAPPFYFAWSPPIGLHGNLPTGYDQAGMLSPGTYRVTVIDSEGCETISDPLLVEEAPSMQVNFVETNDIACFGDSTGMITGIVSGGLPPYSYWWNNGATGAPVLTDLPPGPYQLVSTDLRGCTAVSPMVWLEQPEAPLAAAWSIDSSQTGWAIELEPTGGTPPYWAQWDAGTGNQTGLKAINLASGAYHAVITDSQLCTFEIGPITVGTLASQTEISAQAPLVTVFPNPATAYWWLKIEGRPKTWVLSDALGRALETGAFMPSSAQLYRMEAGIFPEGVFWLTVYFENGSTYAVKLLKRV